MNSTSISTDQLRRAVQIKEQIESLEQQLSSILSGQTVNRTSSIVNARGPRTMSASARARIAAAQRARWAKQKGMSTNGTGATASVPRKRRKMSPAGRAAIAAAARARWARYNAGK